MHVESNFHYDTLAGKVSSFSHKNQCFCLQKINTQNDEQREKKFPCLFGEHVFPFFQCSKFSHVAAYARARKTEQRENGNFVHCVKRKYFHFQSTHAQHVVRLHLPIVHVKFTRIFHSMSKVIFIYLF